MQACLSFCPTPPADIDSIIAETNHILKIESEKAPFRTLAWYDAYDKKNKLKAKDEAYAKKIKKWLTKPHSWQTNPIDAFVLTQANTEEKLVAAKGKYQAVNVETRQLKQTAQAIEALAAQASYQEVELNAQADKAISEYRMQKRKDGKAKKKTRAKPYNQIIPLLALGGFVAVIFALGMQVMSGSGVKFLRGFVFIYIFAVLAYFIAAQADIKALGIGYAAWAIAFGLLISNTVGTPKWVMPAVQVEYYIKTGLVLLGAEILFGKILTIGIPGIFVAWFVTPIVLISTY